MKPALLLIALLAHVSLFAQATATPSDSLTWTNSNPVGFVRSFTIYTTGQSLSRTSVVAASSIDFASLMAGAPAGGYVASAIATGTNGVSSPRSPNFLFIWNPLVSPSAPGSFAIVPSTNAITINVTVSNSK